MKRNTHTAAVAAISAAFLAASPTTAAEVAAQFGFPCGAYAFNAAAEDAAALQQRLIDLSDRAKGIQAAARTEGRELSEADVAEIERIDADFQATEARLNMAVEREPAPQARTQPPQRGAQPRAAAEPRSSAAVTTDPLAASRRTDVAAPDRRMGVLLDRATVQRASAAVFGQEREQSGWKNSDEFFAHALGRTGDPRLMNATGVEGTGVDGGFSVPTEWYRGVIDQAVQQSEFLGRCRLFPSVGNNLTIPMPDKQNQSRTAGIANLLANWAAEAQSQTAQVMKWRAVEMKLHKTFILAEASSELAEDGIGYSSQLTGSMSEATAITIDAGILAGSGVGQPLGILNSASALEIAAESGQTADTITFANIVKMWTRLAPACQKRAVWYVSSAALPQLIYMKHPDSDQPVLLSGGFNDALTGAPAATIFGRPVVVTDLASALGDAGDIVLADMTQYAILMKSRARLEMSNAPGFARDVLSWRMIMRVEGVPLWDAPITPYNGGPTLSWATYLAAR